MKTLEEFNAFVDRQLSTDLQQLETQRITARKWTRWMWVLGILPVILFFVFVIKPSVKADEKTAPDTGALFIYIAVGVILTMAVSFLLRYLMMRQKGAQEVTGYHQDFKNKVVRPIIRFMHDGYNYQPLNHASYEEFTESGLFSKKQYNISGNDQVFGKTGEMNFQYCDLKVTHMPLVTLRGVGADVVFEGSYFIAQFPRYFTTPVYVMSRNGGLFSSSNADTDYIETWNLGKKVTTADAAFNKLFVAYAKDVDDAQVLLTTALLQKIMQLQERSQAQLFISFYNNRIYIGIGHGLDYFEAGLNQSLTDRKLLTDYYMDFTALLQLVEDLQQHQGIWTTTAFSRP